MKRLLALAMIGAFAAVATPALAENAQQERMKTCNAKAGEKKGDERKSFMSECLKGGASPS
jgi:acyl-coenzyme A synthetase/AMP-(fatty) acid ligase